MAQKSAPARTPHEHIHFSALKAYYSWAITLSEYLDTTPSKQYGVLSRRDSAHSPHASSDVKAEQTQSIYYF